MLISGDENQNKSWWFKNKKPPLWVRGWIRIQLRRGRLLWASLLTLFRHQWGGALSLGLAGNFSQHLFWVSHGLAAAISVLFFLQGVFLPSFFPSCLSSCLPSDLQGHLFWPTASAASVDLPCIHRWWFCCSSYLLDEEAVLHFTLALN